MSEEEENDDKALVLEGVRALRLGHGANCSSIGSVVDTLFASAVIGGAVLAAVVAAMKSEPVTVVGPPAADSPHERNDVEEGITEDDAAR